MNSAVDTQFLNIV